jgi:hypothetical protein
MGKNCLDKAKMGMRNKTKGDLSQSDLAVAGKVNPQQKQKAPKGKKPGSAFTFR